MTNNKYNSLNIFRAVSLSLLFLIVTSCDKEELDQGQTAVVLETKTVSNLNAPAKGGMGGTTTGEFTRFSFSENAIVTSNRWDIAFRGTTIIVNGGTKIGLSDEPERSGKGGVSIVSGSLASVTSIPAESSFVSDAPSVYAFPISGENTWYSYNIDTHIVFPKAGKIYVVRTNDGRFAKFEILSYYKDAPAAPTLESVARYYTFKFVYQPNGSTNF